MLVADRPERSCCQYSMQPLCQAAMNTRHFAHNSFPSKTFQHIKKNSRPSPRNQNRHFDTKHQTPADTAIRHFDTQQPCRQLSRAVTARGLVWN